MKDKCKVTVGKSPPEVSLKEVKAWMEATIIVFEAIISWLSIWASNVVMSVKKSSHGYLRWALVGGGLVLLAYQNMLAFETQWVRHLTQVLFVMQIAFWLYELVFKLRADVVRGTNETLKLLN